MGFHRERIEFVVAQGPGDCYLQRPVSVLLWHCLRHQRDNLYEIRRRRNLQCNKN